MRILSLFISVSMLIFSLSSGRAEIIDRIVATVNAEIITISELDEFVDTILDQYKARFEEFELSQKINQARADVLNQMVNDRLIQQEARRRQIKVGEAEVDQAIGRLETRFSSKEEFEEAMLAQDTTLEDLKEKYKSELMVMKLMNEEVRSKVSVSQDEVEAYYDEHKDQMREPEEIKVRHILIKATDQDTNEARQEALELAKRLLAELRAGADFAQLAREYSQCPSAPNGGDLGFFSRGQMVTEFEDTAFRLKVGEISDVVQTRFGYHIIKLEGRKASAPKEFSEVSSEIREKLLRQKTQERLERWIKELRDKADIEIKL
jgi:parvulin-like peptidyl-prolyl isomerase